MTHPLPTDGPEHDIFLQALRDYSDACRLPSLTPGCPFYRAGPQGPWCLDECHDILASYPDAPSPDQLVLTLELVARPRRSPRAKHGLSAPPVAFDARQLSLEDKDRPIDQWRPSSLITELLQNVASPPPTDPGALARRTDRLLEVIQALEGLGFDTEALVRDSMLMPTAITIVTYTTLPFTSVAAGVTSIDGIPAPPEGWVSILLGSERNFAEWMDFARVQGPEWATEQLGKVATSLPRVFNWLSSLDTRSLSEWRAPSTLEFAGAGTIPPPSPSPIFRWVMDRFTATYLEQWATTSLHMEWEYLHGQRIAPSVGRAMRSRHVAEHELAVTMAHRAVSGTDPATVAGDEMVPVSAFTTMVLEHLYSGRRWAGAAVYDAVRRASPKNPEAHNNYGFCLLPDDPVAALPALEQAAELGMDHAPVNVANRMLALFRVSRATSALDLAERHAESDLLRRPGSGWLWSFKSEDPELLQVKSIGKYIAELALHIAEVAADAKAAQVWRRRIAQLSGGDGKPHTGGASAG